MVNGSYKFPELSEVFLERLAQSKKTISIDEAKTDSADKKTTECLQGSELKHLNNVHYKSTVFPLQSTDFLLYQTIHCRYKTT